MNKPGSALLVYSPRILGILVCAFLSLFALDAFGAGKTVLQALPDFAGHVAPALVLLAIVFVSWRHEWVGAMAFTGLAAAYTFFAWDHPAWLAAIAAPLFIVGLLYLASWRHHAASGGSALRGAPGAR